MTNKNEERVYTTRDKSTENGITINNVLLALLILVLGWFGILGTGILKEIKIEIAETKVATERVAETVHEIQIFNGRTTEKLSYITEHMKECKKKHEIYDEKFARIERAIPFDLTE